jgi:hypothetical protein
MDAKAFLKQRWSENSVMKKLAQPNADWGKHVVYDSPHRPPPLPPTAAPNAKMVWNPEHQKYVVGLKRFNYVPDLKDWVNKQEADRRRQEESARRYLELSPTNSDKRKFRRRTRGKTRYFNEKTRTYKTSPSRSRSRGRSRTRRSRSRPRH